VSEPLRDGGLFLHSPVKLAAELRTALDALGPVRAIVSVEPIRSVMTRVSSRCELTRGS
jgi:hypothetical protein